MALYWNSLVGRIKVCSPHLTIEDVKLRFKPMLIYEKQKILKYSTIIPQNILINAHTV